MFYASAQALIGYLARAGRFILPGMNTAVGHRNHHIRFAAEIKIRNRPPHSRQDYRACRADKEFIRGSGCAFQPRSISSIMKEAPRIIPPREHLAHLCSCHLHSVGCYWQELACGVHHRPWQAMPRRPLRQRKKRRAFPSIAIFGRSSRPTASLVMVPI